MTEKEKVVIIKKIHKITKADWKIIADLAENRTGEWFHKLCKDENGTTYQLSQGFACVRISLKEDGKIHMLVMRNGQYTVQKPTEIQKFLEKYDIKIDIFEPATNR